jgi:hypothetical protein
MFFLMKNKEVIGCLPDPIEGDFMCCVKCENCMLKSRCRIREIIIDEEKILICREY